MPALSCDYHVALLPFTNMGLIIPRPAERLATQRAIIVDQNGKFIASSDAPCPSMQRDQFLVKTQAVAINPSDTKMLGDFQVKGGILGTDFAGAVIAVGEDVHEVRVGDRVAGAQNAMMAGRPECGAFGQFNVNAGRVWLRLPPTLSVEAGASLPAGICTAGLAIRSLGLPLPPQVAASSAKVSVYGGSTATGTIAIQLLKQ
jgi:NADPH:quinone reductase-like Zn-dependent oxidoreductase